MNKKGIISADMMWYIVRFFMLIAVILVVVFVTNAFITTDIDPTQAHIDIMTNRLLYSKHAISYTNSETNRVYPGIVDVEKMHNKNITEAFELENNNIVAMKITLQDKDEKEIKTVYLSEEWYTRWKDVANINIQGPGGATQQQKKIYVLYRSDEQPKHQPGYLIIDAVLPK